MCFTLRLHTSAAPPRVGLTQALDAMWKIVALAVSIFWLLAGCNDSPAPSASAPPSGSTLPSVYIPPPPDVSFLKTLNGRCAAQPGPQVVLSAAEQCWVKELAAHCSPANDCLISCLASGQGRRIGGGCWHVCWPNVPGFDEWQAPTRSARCKSLGHVNGI